MPRFLIISFVSIVLNTVISSSGWAAGGALPGTGLENDPYLIEDRADFNAFTQDQSKWGTGVFTKLTTDIDLAGTTYTQALIAPSDPQENGFTYSEAPFAGVFNGNGHALKNLTISTPTSGGSYSFLGLFGYINGATCRIENLTLSGGSITSNSRNTRHAGAICGYCNLATIKNCSSSVDVVGTIDLPTSKFAGLCGYNKGGLLENCHVTANVSADDDVAGLCCHNDGGRILQSSAIGVFKVRQSDIGGICISNSNGGSIVGCYSSGTISGRRDEAPNTIGGLCASNSGLIHASYASHQIQLEFRSWGVGGLVSGNSGTITQCFSSAQIVCGDEAEYVGGFCASNGGTIRNCYSTGSVVCGIESEFLGGFCGKSSGLIEKVYSTTKLTVGNGSYNYDGFIGQSSDAQLNHGYVHVWTGLHNSAAHLLLYPELTDASNFVGFDFADVTADGVDDIWELSEGYMPKLAWQTSHDPRPPSLGVPVTSLKGGGTLENPFLIENVADFNEFRTNPELSLGHYRLMSDIDLSGQVYVSAVVNKMFDGTFDGGGHRIYNATISGVTDDSSYLGIFSSTSGIIKNLIVEDLALTSARSNSKFSDYIGGICGHLWGVIDNCKVTGSITLDSQSQYIGGVCGYNRYGIIKHSKSTVVMTGINVTWVGGICGENRAGTIEFCSSEGHINVEDFSRYVGGIAGTNIASSIRHCNSKVSIGTGNDLRGNCRYLGGMCGMNNVSVIVDSRASGSVHGGVNSSYVGGFCGDNASSGEITGSAASGDVSGWVDVGGFSGWNEGISKFCYSTGHVSGLESGHAIGGFCGLGRGEISDCYSTGSVSAGLEAKKIGGFCGEHFLAIITRCYSSGLVSANNQNTEVGGFIGVSTWAPENITASFWNTSTSGQQTSDAGLGKSNLEMQTLATFTQAGWNFSSGGSNDAEGIWRMDGYPILSWQLQRDSDNDQWPDHLEAMMGTNPLDHSDHFKMWLNVDAGELCLSYSPHSDACLYEIQWTTDLTSPESWQKLSGLSFTGELPRRKTVLPHSLENTMFYRVRIYKPGN